MVNYEHHDDKPASAEYAPYRGPEVSLGTRTSNDGGEGLGVADSSKE
jgi:hypothetical protein